jgi:glycosyltransferase involved in cell wall biosynthesis
MRILQIYNQYRSRSTGESAIVANTVRLLELHGQDVSLLGRDSLDIRTIGEKAQAAIQGIYSFPAARLVRNRIRDWRPDVVHVHNLYPRFSPSVLVACRREGLPVVMTVHNYNLTCPTWCHLYKGRVCEACVGGHEYRCVLKNCRNNILESAVYALRSTVARRLRLFHDNVSVFIAYTPFAKERLLRAGFRDEQIAVVPNSTAVTDESLDRSPGEYVAFAGRISPEKGLDTFLAAAERTPDVPFKVAGEGPILSGSIARAPHNVSFVGRLPFDELLAFYRKARFLVVPSVWLEPFGMVVIDAMALGVPVIASRIGGLPHVVDDGTTGFLFEAGDAEDLVRQVRRMWDDPELCARLGSAGKEKAALQYNQETYYNNLMSVYTTAIQRSQKTASTTPLVHIKNANLPVNALDQR